MYLFFVEVIKYSLCFKVLLSIFYIIKFYFMQYYLCIVIYIYICIFLFFFIFILCRQFN